MSFNGNLAFKLQRRIAQRFLVRNDGIEDSKIDEERCEKLIVDDLVFERPVHVSAGMQIDLDRDHFRRLAGHAEYTGVAILLYASDEFGRSRDSGGDIQAR